MSATTPPAPPPEDPTRPQPPPANPPAGQEVPELLGIEEFARWDLRVARVLTAERHPKADRLLLLRIDCGGEERQVVAGIASAYQPEELVGRSICIVANLKPAKLRGEVSQGMLLAASDGEVISLLRPEREVPPGSRIR